MVIVSTKRSVHFLIRQKNVKKIARIKIVQNVIGNSVGMKKDAGTTANVHTNTKKSNN